MNGTKVTELIAVGLRLLGLLLFWYALIFVSNTIGLLLMHDVVSIPISGKGFGATVVLAMIGEILMFVLACVMLFKPLPLARWLHRSDDKPSSVIHVDAAQIQIAGICLIGIYVALDAIKTLLFGIRNGLLYADEAEHLWWLGEVAVPVVMLMLGVLLAVRAGAVSRWLAKK